MFWSQIPLLGLHSVTPIFVVCCSVPKSSSTLCSPTDCSTPGFPVLHCLPELAQIHVHWVSDAIHPPHPLSPSSFAFNLSEHQVFSNESAVCIRWPKHWSFSFSICPSNEYSGVNSFRMDWLGSLLNSVTWVQVTQEP